MSRWVAPLFVQDNYLTVSRERPTAPEYLPQEISTEPNSGTRWHSQKSCQARHELDDTYGNSRQVFDAQLSPSSARSKLTSNATSPGFASIGEMSMFLLARHSGAPPDDLRNGLDKLTLTVRATLQVQWCGSTVFLQRWFMIELGNWGGAG